MEASSRVELFAALTGESLGHVIHDESQDLRGEVAFFLNVHPCKVQVVDVTPETAKVVRKTGNQKLLALSGEEIGELSRDNPDSFFSDTLGAIADYFRAPLCRVDVENETYDSVTVVKMDRCGFDGMDGTEGSCRYCDCGQPTDWCEKCGYVHSYDKKCEELQHHLLLPDTAGDW
jgi:hypothetical protein